MNYRYGHLIDGKLVYASNVVTADGKVYVNPPAEVYLRLDPPEKLIVDQQPAEPAPEGYHYEANGWDQTQTELRRSYQLVEDPQEPAAPRKFSKMYLEIALFNAGLLSQVDALIDSQVITNDFGQEMPLRRLYDKALVFSEDNEYFGQYLEQIKTALSLTDEQVEAILSQCVAEE